MGTLLARSPEVSVVFAAHREGRLLKATLGSLRAGLEDLTKAGFRWEVIATLDSGNPATRAQLRRCRWLSQILEANFGDPAQARNHAVAATRGRWLAVMDADNLFSRSWLSLAARLLRENPRQRWVLHPELEINFGRSPYLRRNIDQLSPEFDPTLLLHSNYWDLASFAPREAFVDVSYVRTSAPDSTGFEDWHWNCETIARGWAHRSVPETVHFRRLKTVGSVNRENMRQAATVPDSALWARLARSEIPSSLLTPAQASAMRRFHFARLSQAAPNWLKEACREAVRLEPKLGMQSLKALRELPDRTPSLFHQVPFFGELCAALTRSRAELVSGPRSGKLRRAQICIEHQPGRPCHGGMDCFAERLLGLPFPFRIQVLLRALFVAAPSQVESTSSRLGRATLLSYAKLLRKHGIRTRVLENESRNSPVISGIELGGQIQRVETFRNSVRVTGRCANAETLQLAFLVDGRKIPAWTDQLEREDGTTGFQMTAYFRSAAAALNASKNFKVAATRTKAWTLLPFSVKN